MGGMEEQLEGAINDQARRIVIRGKRTKRHRPALSSSSTAGGSSGDHIGSNSSPATSSELCESTEEEEDMANCLILLAQGGGGEKIGRRQERCSSRKFTEIMGSSTTAAPPGKVGFYVHECKTCNRTFPSFQALGGHRASHKKPKTAAEEEKPPVPIPIPQSSTVPADHQSNDVKLNNSNKIHECSICGAEFSSGQALGGHMRRHRATPALPATAKPMSIIGDNRRQDQVEKERRNILELDLNLPAPEDDRREFSMSPSKFQYASAKQPIVFSSPTLVDCHY